MTSPSTYFPCFKSSPIEQGNLGGASAPSFYSNAFEGLIGACPQTSPIGEAVLLSPRSLPASFCNAIAGLYPLGFQSILTGVISRMAVSLTGGRNKREKRFQRLRLRLQAPRCNLFEQSQCQSRFSCLEFET